MGRPNEHERIACVFSILHLLEKDHFYSYSTLGKLMGRNEQEAQRAISALLTIDMEGYRPPFFEVGDGERAVLERGGEPSDTAEEEPTGIWVWDGFEPFDAPFDFTTFESQALIASLDYMGAQPDDPLRQKIVARLFEEATDETRTRLLIDSANRDQFMSRLSYLVESRRLARIVYRPLGASTDHVHLVEPHRVYATPSGEWYLDAFPAPDEPDANEMRTYRIDRIVSMDEPGGHFERHPYVENPFIAQLGCAPLAYLSMPANEPLEARDWPGAVVVGEDAQLDSAAAKARALVGAGEKLVAVPFIGYNWIARQIIGKAGRTHVIAPDDLRAEVARISANMADESHRVRQRLEKEMASV